MAWKSIAATFGVTALCLLVLALSYQFLGPVSVLWLTATAPRGYPSFIGGPIGIVGGAVLVLILYWIDE